MASSFWGMVIKPGKLLTLSFEKVGGRLRISRATLGFGDATDKTVVQCNVGNRRPLLLCALLPNKKESCHLDLEFEEADDVVFSVIGPRIVHLTGYYIRQYLDLNPHSDTESHDNGMDIGGKQRNPISYAINYCSGCEDCVDGYLIRDWESIPHADTEDLGTYSEDLEDFPGDWTSYCSEEDTYGGSFINNGEIEVLSSGGMDELTLDSYEPKERNDGKLQRETKPPFNEEKTDANYEKEEVETLEKVIFSDQDIIHGNNTKHINQNMPVSNGEDQMQMQSPHDLAKPTKKRKECLAKEEKASQVHEDHSALGGDKEQESEASSNLNISIKSDQLDKKVKKRMKRDLNMGVIKTADNQETMPMKYEDQSTKRVPIRTRTFSNGLIIEDLESGPPDGEVSAIGKEVEIYYTGMLKESGHVFESNVGKAALKFRLGDEINEECNVCFDGMHVGDKRRLIIPPSMCLGDEEVMPNSWIVFDVELVGINNK